MYLESLPSTLLTLHGIVPPVLVTILVIVVIVFIIKSLLKFAILVGAIAFVIFIAWQMGWVPGF